MQALFACASEKWAPGIGDPTIGGWLTVAAYAVAAILAFRRAGDAFAALPVADGRAAAFWLTIAGILILLGINKQLDLQSLMTALGRCHARAEGWYEARGGVQRAFVIAGAAGAGLAAAAFAFAFRKIAARRPLVIAGLAGLLAFVLIRMTSIHAADALINARLAGLKANWILEIGALGLVIAGARGRRQAGSR